MRYEVVEERDEWIVRREGCELARFRDQEQALNDVTRRLRAASASPTDETARLSVRFERRNGSR